MRKTDERVPNRLWHKAAQGIAWALLILHTIPMFGRAQSAMAAGVSPFSFSESKLDAGIMLGLCLFANLAFMLAAILCLATKGQKGKLLCVVSLVLIGLRFVIR